MTPPDLKARERALTDFQSNILVEAAAGTGKTSLLAGRVALMLAHGISPANIAAITFTDLAASELEARIRQTVDELRSGILPPALEGVVALPMGDRQRANLDAAATELVRMTVSTIHGFCQALINSHGLDVGLDPGAQVADEITAEAMFDQTVDVWLKAKLAAGADETHPAAILAKSDPLGVVKRLRELANLKRKHSDGKVILSNGHADELAEFLDAVEEFARWYAANPGDDWTFDLISDLQRLATFYAGTEDKADFEGLWGLAQPPRIPIMRENKLVFSGYDRTKAWKEAFGKDDGARRAETADEMYGRIDSAFRGLIGAVAEQLVYQLSAVLDEVLAAYAARKRETAVLDYDDLLHWARSIVRDHPGIRNALAARYQHLLVDEFQDTDPIQTEIVFLLSGHTWVRDWTEAALRSGALFIVGDPKQAIYRFRRADIEIYNRAKNLIREASTGCVIDVTANFRSRPQIIYHVNETFRQTLAAEGQPGFVPLQATVKPLESGFPSAVKMTIETIAKASAEEQREAEAERVAEVCAGLIGAFSISDAKGLERKLRAGEIALLAPTHTDLWRYERALEAKGISVSSQAGHALFRRQELQDILALVRTLADPLDTAAFGALMRGPVVGLSDEDLLDITQGLEPDGDGLRRFQLRTPADMVTHPLAKEILGRLQTLHRAASQLTPKQLISLAIERLNLRVVLAARHRQRNARAIANLDAIVELAKPYDVMGLKAFAVDLQRGWEDKKNRRQPEGRVDPSEDAVEIVTMHSSKGLEWPVVILINSSTQFRPPSQFIYRQSDGTLHWLIDGIESSAMVAAREEEEIKEARQRERLWYVATTRARDLLVIPYLPGAKSNSWSRVMDLGQSRLPEIPLKELPVPTPGDLKKLENSQTAEIFAAEAEAILAATIDVTWHRPSQHDADRDADLEDAFVLESDVTDREPTRGAGALRGAILHKLMEELLTGELSPGLDAACLRAAQLLEQLSLHGAVSAATPDPEKMAETALHTYAMPELASYLGQLIPEFPLWAAEFPHYLAGRADAVAMTDEGISLVIDWKSDVNPKPADRAMHAGQLREYLRVTGARRGGLVYMSRGEIVWISANTKSDAHS